MSTKSWITLLTVLTLMLPFMVHCNSKRILGPKEIFEWTVYTMADGLVRNLIFDVAIDSLDRVWIGTGGGINVFDGVKWDTIDANDGLPYKSIHVLHFDQQGNLWIGSGDNGNGLVKYDGTTFTLYTTADGLSDNRILAIASQQDGTIWVGTTFGGACKFDGTSWQIFDTQYLSHSNVRSIYVENDSSIWFGTSNGVTHYDGQAWTRYLGRDEAEPVGYYKIIEAIDFDYHKTGWFAFSDGVYKYESDTFTLALFNNFEIYGISDIAHYGSEQLWFSSYSMGVFRYRQGVWENYSMSDGLPTTWISSVEADSKGNFWFGTQSGLVKLTILSD